MIPRSCHRLVLVGLVLGTAACSSDQTDDQSGLDLDAGSLMSEEPQWTGDEAWSIGTEPLVTIGDSRDSTHVLSRVVRAFRVSEGYMVVNGNPPGVRIYESSGEHIRTLGRRGDGPGEFRSIYDVWWVHQDSILLYDPALGRLTYLSPSGALLRALQYEQRTPGAGVANVLLGRFLDGSYLALPNGSPRPTEGQGLVEVHIPVLRVAADLGAVDTLMTSAGGRYFLHDRREGYQDWRPQPFAPLTAVTSSGRSFFVSDTEDFWIEERRLDGSLLRRFARAHTPEPVTRDDWDGLRDQRIASLRREMERAGNAEGIDLENEIRGIERVFALMPKPDHKPAHARQLILDRADNLWVRERAEAGEPPRWTVFSPSGRYLGRVPGLASLRVTEIGADFVLGVWTDPLGVQTVREFALVKPGPE